MASRTLLVALCCMCLASFALGAPPPAAGAGARKAGEPEAVPATAGAAAAVAATSATAAASPSSNSIPQPAVTNTYFRPQSEITTTDASTEQNIPGLSPTNVPAVQAATPNLEQLAPTLTIMAPFLPTIYGVMNLLGLYLPNAYPLAGTGPQGNWLDLVIRAFVDAFTGRGPRPMLAPAIMVATPEAYQKLPQQLAQFGGLPRGFMLLPPPLKFLAGCAVHRQLTTNMLLPQVPLLGKAANGTILRTMAGTNLTLIVKPEGRFLVSDHQVIKLVRADVPARIGLIQLTLEYVDSFVVEKFNPAPPPLPSWLTISPEQARNMPQTVNMIGQAIAAQPAALAQMPGALTQMVTRQIVPNPRG